MTARVTTAHPAQAAGMHTPGPWAIKREGVIAQQSSGEVVATCGYKVAVGSDEDDANARLIAAAPELADALDNLIGALPADMDDLLRQRMEGGFAALRKAGRS